MTTTTRDETAMIGGQRDVLRERLHNRSEERSEEVVNDVERVGVGRVFRYEREKSDGLSGEMTVCVAREDVKVLGHVHVEMSKSFRVLGRLAAQDDLVLVVDSRLTKRAREVGTVNSVNSTVLIDKHDVHPKTFLRVGMLSQSSLPRRTGKTTLENERVEVTIESIVVIVVIERHASTTSLGARERVIEEHGRRGGNTSTIVVEETTTTGNVRRENTETKQIVQND